MRTWTKPGPHQVIAAANNDDFSHSNGSRTAGSGEVGRGGEGGVCDGWDNQVISIPPGPGPNVIISDRTGILSKDACANSDQVALATSINSYAVQHGSNVPGSFFNIHHIDSHLRIREADGNESAPRFQPRGSMVSVDAGGGAIFSPQAAAAAPPVQPRLLEVAGSIAAASLAGT